MPKKRDSLNPANNKSGIEGMGYRIAKSYIEQGYTMTQFAQKAGVFASMLSRWESGEQTPSLKTLQKVADALNVTVTWLAYGVDEQKDVEQMNMASEIVNRPALLRLFNELVNAPDSVIDAVTELIKRIEDD